MFMRPLGICLRPHLFTSFRGAFMNSMTNEQFKPFLTIGMATFDDYDGVYFSIQAIRLFHPEILNRIEFVVIDNNPDGVCGHPLKQLGLSIPNYRYIPLRSVKGTAVRERIFVEAQGDFVLCMDCHVLFVSGALQRLLAYFDTHPESIDLLQGPLINDDLLTLHSHWEPEWNKGMWGRWAHSPLADDIDGDAFDIPMQGLGSFACRKAAWPGFNSDFRGFGGEEGYIHEKFRQRGARTLCLPALRWMHRFARPMGVPYPTDWANRIRNYILGFHELGMSKAEMYSHFMNYLPLAHEDIQQIICDVENEVGWSELDKKIHTMSIFTWTFSSRHGQRRDPDNKS